MKALDIVVVGELNIDLILTGLPSIPEIGQCQLSKDMHFTLGSASAIFASNIARLDLQVGFIGKIGNDDFGEFILSNLQEKQVDISHIIKENTAKTGICVCMSFPEDYAMASYPGVRETMRLVDVDMEYVAAARHLHMSSYYLQPGMQEGCSELFRKAKEMGLTTSLDPDSDPSGRWDNSIFEVLHHIDVFLPNETEALKLTGCNDAESALDILSQRVETVVIKLGDRGALARNRENIIATDVFHIEVVDTTGAGDSFNAGFIYKFLNGAKIEECLIWGNTCGAISTTKLGGTAAFPTLTQIRDFLGKREDEVKDMLSIIKAETRPLN